jgi:hypothetical protein
MKISNQLKGGHIQSELQISFQIGWICGIDTGYTEVISNVE